jgi:hypothetical protein
MKRSYVEQYAEFHMNIYSISTTPMVAELQFDDPLNQCSAVQPCNSTDWQSRGKDGRVAISTACVWAVSHCQST